jgi:hypothetical protein
VVERDKVGSREAAVIAAIKTYGQVRRGAVAGEEEAGGSEHGTGSD